MYKIRVILKSHKKPNIVSWVLDYKDCLSMDDNGITIYDGDGSFRAYYYSKNVIGVEVDGE